VFKNNVLREIYEPKKEEVKDTHEKCLIRSFMICNLKQLLLMFTPRRMRCTWGRQKCFWVQTGKPEEARPL